MTSPSGKPILIFAIVITVGVVVGALLLRQPSRTTYGIIGDDKSIIQPVDVRTDRKAVNSFSRRRPAGGKTTSSRVKAVGVQEIAVQPAAILPPLSGYIVDSFDGWTTISPGYRAEGIALKNGSITLSGDAESTAPRSGTLESPAISLRTPALAGASDNSAPLEEGASVQLEISLSENGSDWSPWIAAEKHARPDGRRVAAPVQASLAKADLINADHLSSSTISGPSLRYRLHLSSSGVAAPAVADLRIWKREYR